MKILDFLNSSIINLVVTHKNSPTWLPWMKKHWKKFIALYVSRLDSFDWSKNWRSWTFFKGFKITLTVQLTQENIFLFHEIFHESSVIVIVQIFVAIATRKWFSILWRSTLHAKLFVTITTRKYISISRIISWIYTTCNCANLYLQL